MICEFDQHLHQLVLAVIWGAGVRIVRGPCPLPVQVSPNRIHVHSFCASLANHARLLNLYRANAVAVVGGEEMWVAWGHAAGSTDMGDLSLSMPVLHPYHGGVSGPGHGPDYCTTA